MFELRGVLENWHGFMIDALGECGEQLLATLKKETLIWQTLPRLTQKNG